MRLEEAKEKIEKQGESIYHALKKEGIEQFFQEETNAIKKHLHLEQSDIDELVQESIWYCEHKDWKQAQEALGCLLFYEPLNTSHYLRLGAVLLQIGEFQKAADSLAFAAFLSQEDPTPYLYLGECFLELNDKEKAKDAFTECIALSGTDPHYKELVDLARDGIIAVR